MWSTIRDAVLSRHEHAVAHGEHEVRVILAFGPGERSRIAVLLRREGEGCSIFAMVGAHTFIDGVTVLRLNADLAHGSLILVDRALVVRARLATIDVEPVLQSVARGALQIRRALAPARPRMTDANLFAHAL